LPNFFEEHSTNLTHSIHLFSERESKAFIRNVLIKKIKMQGIKLILNARNVIVSAAFKRRRGVGSNRGLVIYALFITIASVILLMHTLLVQRKETGEISLPRKRREVEIRMYSLLPFNK